MLGSRRCRFAAPAPAAPGPPSALGTVAKWTRAHHFGIGISGRLREHKENRFCKVWFVRVKVAGHEETVPIWFGSFGVHEAAGHKGTVSICFGSFRIHEATGHNRTFPVRFGSFRVYEAAGHKGTISVWFWLF